MVSLSIIGPRSAGKTLTAIELSILLNRPFIDADSEFMKRYGSINRFIYRRGLGEFCQIESYLLEDICSDNNSRDVVLSPGRCTLSPHLNKKNRLTNAETLHNLGSVCYIIPFSDLEMSLGVLIDRLKRDRVKRGALRKLDFQGPIYNAFLTNLQRENDIYEYATNKTIYTYTNSPKEVAKVISNNFLLN